LGSNEAKLLLYDPSSNVIIDMKKTGNYHFEMRGKHSFKIFFGVDEENISPDITALSQAYPNPFTTSTNISFITSSDRPHVQISVYDLLGQKISNIVNDQFEPGFHEGVWDGNDDHGARAAQGLYIYRLTATNTASQTGKVILK
jgi:hypothetical protein